MEKISLYDLLSVLLPGAILTLSIEMLMLNLGFEYDSVATNQYFSLTIFLSFSIFLGSLINISTRGLLKIYRKIGLYTSIYQIYEQAQALNTIKPFYKKLMDKLCSDDCSKEQKVEQLWSEIYFELEATEKIGSPKSFQSFYFFFRNFFTLTILLYIPLIIVIIINWISFKYLIFLAVNILGTFLSVYAGKWYRERMVERMFWTFYSLNKNKQL